VLKTNLLNLPTAPGSLGFAQMRRHTHAPTKK
jgi:hypothetical protein